MDKQSFKQTLHVWLLYIKTRRSISSIVLFVLVLVLSVILHSCSIPTSCTIITATVIVVMLGTEKYVVVALRRQGEGLSKEGLSPMHTQQDCGYGYDVDLSAGSHFLPGSEGEVILTNTDENLGLSLKQPTCAAILEDMGSTVEKPHGNGVPLVYQHDTDTHSADGDSNSEAKHSHQPASDMADVPELEDCSTSSEEDEVCKSVLEATVLESGSHEDITFSDSILQSAIKAAPGGTEEDENSVDKHQILPLEGCKNFNPQESGTDSCDDVFHSCSTTASLKGLGKLMVTDAELQKASSEFYTLEGDVLWSKSELIKKPPIGKKLASWDQYKLCKHGCCMLPSSSSSSSSSSKAFSSFRSRAQTVTQTYIETMAGVSKVVHHADASKAQTLSELACKAVAVQQEINEDVFLDKELRAIAFRCGNQGEESSYMSTAGSFRDMVGSFREFESCWPEYVGMEEEDGVVGCCDNHAKPCISHSRSRSKVLQSDPLLSKASLIREQDMMDVLWQEYDDDMRQQHKATEGAQKQRLGGGTHGGSSSSSHTAESVNTGDPDDGSDHLQGDEYVMKLNAAPPGCDRNGSSHCRLGCDGQGPCWHMAKARGYQRRRHFVGICRVLREFGLKQCMQSSEVDN